MKKSGNGLFAALVLAVIGIAFLWQPVPEWIASMQTPMDFTEVSESELAAGKHAKGEVFAILDSFASEQTWTERDDGSRSAKKTSKIYYIVPVGEESYIGIECYAKDKAAYNTLNDATLSWLAGETEYIEADTVPFDGRLMKMDDELYQYMVEWFQDVEYFGEDVGEDEIKQYVLPYMLQPFAPGLYAMLTIGGVMLAIAILVLCVSLAREKKRKKQMEELANMPAPAYDPNQVDTDALKHLQQ